MSGGKPVLVSIIYSHRAHIRCMIKNNSGGLVRLLRLTHRAHITPIGNQDATIYTKYPWAQLAQHHIFRASAGATLYLLGVAGYHHFCWAHPDTQPNLQDSLWNQGKGLPLLSDLGHNIFYTPMVHVNNLLLNF